MCAGAEKGVQGSRYTGVQVIKVQSLYFPMGSCRGMKVFKICRCSGYLGVHVYRFHCTQLMTNSFFLSVNGLYG